MRWMGCFGTPDLVDGRRLTSAGGVPSSRLMRPLRPLAGIIIFATLLQSGCTVMRLVKAASSPVSLAGEVVKQPTKVPAKSVRAGGKVSGHAVAGAGRV